ncbi:uncharacterized protein LOC120131544 [Hibiscus syriacus]|uniref:uncharacterized protein LOC120131544 n=1 Tax=Hibiscus syriacus TaxID=106335 RepID=UPI0019247996|nr:uncharacterized protein LOC120131544 [Hibiscus syriacus]
MQLAWDLGLRRITVESDCKEAILVLQTRVGSGVGSSMVHHIQELVKRSWEVRFVFAPREYNRVADCMTNLAWKWPFGFHVYQSPPVDVGVSSYVEDSTGKTEDTTHSRHRR